MKKRKLLISSLLSMGLFVGLIMLMQTPKRGQQDHYGGYNPKASHSLDIELKWMDLASTERFEVVRDTLQYQLDALSLLGGRQTSDLYFCCEDERLRLAHWGGGAYSLNLHLNFPSEIARDRAVDEILNQGLARLDVRQQNRWQAEGSASLLLPIPGKNGEMLAIEHAAIKMSAYLERTQLLG